jgi:hypothetical protein
MRKRRGFTIVELLAATALAMLLTAVTVGMLRNLSLQKRALLEPRGPQPWRHALLERLRWDLINARQMSLLPGEWHLIGYNSRSFADGKPTQRPTEVVYFVARTVQRHWLVRQEIHTDELTNRNLRIELVLDNVERLIVNRLDHNGREQPIPQTTSPVPHRLRFRLMAFGQAVPIVDETLYVRWEP